MDYLEQEERHGKRLTTEPRRTQGLSKSLEWAMDVLCSLVFMSAGRDGVRKQILVAGHSKMGPIPKHINALPPEGPLR